MKFALRLSLALTMAFAAATLAQVVPLLKWSWRDLLIERYTAPVAAFLALLWINLFALIRGAQRTIRGETLGSRLKRAVHEQQPEIAALGEALFRETESMNAR